MTQASDVNDDAAMADLVEWRQQARDSAWRRMTACDLKMRHVVACEEQPRCVVACGGACTAKQNL